MKIPIFLCAFCILFAQDEWKATLSHKDIAGPISLSTPLDSLFQVYGSPTSVQRTIGFCGKGPKMIDGKIVEGDSVYCDSLLIYALDSLTVCTNLDDQIQYYYFTTAKLRTARGIQVGDSKEAVLKAYGKPSKHDESYNFGEALPCEDAALGYVCSGDANGIAFSFNHGKVCAIYIGRGTAC